VQSHDHVRGFAVVLEKKKRGSSMTQESFSGFVQVDGTKTEPKTELYLLEKFMVTACATECRCVVTATATLDSKVRTIAVKKCRNDHDAVMTKLSAAAKFRVLVMVNSFERDQLARANYPNKF
jgi:hypothetical protein